MIFVTIGTQAPFDRFIRLIDEWAATIDEPVIAQTCNGEYKPKHIKTVSFIQPDEFNKYLDDASLIIGHAGMGTILTAMKKDKPILVFPRMASLGEHRNEHQLATSKKMKEKGYCNVAMDEDELHSMLTNYKNLKALHHIDDMASPNLLDDIKNFILQ